ncbi:glycosyltransferase [Granulosicoccus sp.]|nr:glycosyltransferase [Granulosicoccus sp.]MDB4224838.1 glycosyltransferase [Granulosicoccus sp.]
MNCEATTPLVSVVIPAYNCELYVADTLKSVINQTYQSIEIIVINDGSTDETLTVLRHFKNQIRIIDQSNHGVANARNVGIAIARGEFVAFLDADDQWAPTKLEVQLGSLNGFDWSYTDSLYFGNSPLNGQKRSELSPQPDGWVFNALIEENFLTTSTVVVRKSILENLGGFDEKAVLREKLVFEDWILWLRIAQIHPISKINKPLVLYRVALQSLSRNEARKSLDAHLHIYGSVIPSMQLNLNIKSLVRKGLSKSYNTSSYIAEDSGDFKFALYCAWKAMVLSAPSWGKVKRLLRTMLNLVTIK